MEFQNFSESVQNFSETTQNYSDFWLIQTIYFRFHHWFSYIIYIYAWLELVENAILLFVERLNSAKGESMLWQKNIVSENMRLAK